MIPYHLLTFLLPGTQLPYASATPKATESIGAFIHVPIYRHMTLSSFLGKLFLSTKLTITTPDPFKRQQIAAPLDCFPVFHVRKCFQQVDRFNLSFLWYCKVFIIFIIVTQVQLMRQSEEYLESLTKDAVLRHLSTTHIVRAPKTTE